MTQSSDGIDFRDIFSLGFGPFRWVCTSGNPDDLATTDKIAIQVFNDIIAGKEHISNYMKADPKNHHHVNVFQRAFHPALCSNTLTTCDG